MDSTDSKGLVNEFNTTSDIRKVSYILFLFVRQINNRAIRLI